MCILVLLAAPTKPLNLTATTTDTSATLSWDPPLYNGGLDDVFYIIKYKTSEEQQFSYYSPTPPITATSATVTSLTPLTIYMFMVVAENGVSQEFPHLFNESDRTSSAIVAITKEIGEYIKTMVFYLSAEYQIFSCPSLHIHSWFHCVNNVVIYTDLTDTALLYEYPVI